MLHVVRSGSRHMPDQVLRGMFAARKSVFVDLLKWDVPVLDGRYEVDQFDDGHADYLVLTTSAGDHLGSARLLPTVRPHILGSFYPMLCAGPVPCGASTYEVTRFCLDRTLRAQERRAVRDTLVAAIAEHAIGHGIDRLTAIAELGWARQILEFGWTCRMLGDPQPVRGQRLAALEIMIGRATPALLAAAGIGSTPLPLPLDRAAA